jgi:GT2 family glycosyltransferase
LRTGTREVVKRLNVIVETAEFLARRPATKNGGLPGDVRKALDACEDSLRALIEEHGRDGAAAREILALIDRVRDGRANGSGALLSSMVDQWLAQVLAPGGGAGGASGGGDVAVHETDNFPARQPGKNLCETRANIVAASRVPGAPLVSILVTAYNRLEKTKLCVESILQHTTGIEYELILFDHGSADGTFEYFKSVEHPRRRIVRVTKNATRLVAELMAFSGRFMVLAGNDMVMTHNWLSNMLKCAESDSRIGLVVPLTSNVSNFQEVDLGFTSLEQMQEKAAAFNVSDPRKWHDRLRLVTPMYMIRKECFDLVGLGDYGLGQFMDDDLAFRARRAGYRCVLCKDTFVHHNHDFRNAEDKDPVAFNEGLEKGRKDFMEKHFGIDAWDDASDYEPDMIQMLRQPPSGREVEVLGVDVKCGTPILEVANRLREFGTLSARLSAFSQDARYYVDLKTICAGDVRCGRPEDLPWCFDEACFDYIVLGAPLNSYADPGRLLRGLLRLLRGAGQLFVKLRNTFDIYSMMNMLGNNRNFYGDYPAISLWSRSPRSSVLSTVISQRSGESFMTSRRQLAERSNNMRKS